MPKVQPIPSAGNGRGRRGRRARVSTSLAEINVVPLVDVMLVLLIIFMVAAPMMTQGMPVNLPQAKRAPAITAQQVYVTVPATFAKDRVVQIDKDEIRVDILAERMRQVMLQRTDKSVFVRADGAVEYKDLVFVMDRLKDAGIEKVGLVTRPEGQR
ncbi:MAG TPA: ExbD/TolR family protein [Vicinamibacterales bacterium]